MAPLFIILDQNRSQIHQSTSSLTSFESTPYYGSKCNAVLKMCACAPVRSISLQSFYMGLHFSKMEDVAVEALIVLHTDYILWLIIEHKIHRRSKGLTVLKPLLLDENTKIKVLYWENRVRSFLYRILLIHCILFLPNRACWHSCVEDIHSDFYVQVMHWRECAA